MEHRQRRGKSRSHILLKARQKLTWKPESQNEKKSMTNRILLGSPFIAKELEISNGVWYN